MIAEREFDRIHGPRRYETIQLPESEWYKCRSCGGSGMFLEPGDLHRSKGYVPCSCSDGLRKTRTVEIPRRVRVRAGRRVVSEDQG